MLDSLPDRLTQIARVLVAKAGTIVQGRQQINFQEGTNVAITATDNAAEERVDVSFAVASAAPSGAAGGDLAGTYPNPTVTESALDHALIGGTDPAIAKTLLTTRGDIIVRDASAPVRKAVGSANTVLRSDGTDPGWGTVGQDNLASGYRLTYTGTSAPTSPTPTEGDEWTNSTTDITYVYDGSGWVAKGQYGRAWTIISDTLLGSDTTFGSITVPQTFTHLKVLITGRGNAAVTTAAVVVRFNGDGGANYDNPVLRMINSSPSGYSTVGGSNAEGGILPGTSAGASYAGNAEWTIFDYRSTTFYKTMQVVTANPSATAAQTYIQVTGATWRSTAAITSFIADFNAVGTGWLTGSRLTLLGIR